MKSSPLQLEHYFLAESHCKARTEPPGEGYESWGPADAEWFKTEVRMFRGEDEADFFQIQLSIETVSEAESSLPYEILLHIIGYFRVDPDFKHDNLEHLVQVNGASVLYSAARDFVLTLTSRGPWGPLMLPTVNFRIGRKAPETTGVAEDSKS